MSLRINIISRRLLNVKGFLLNDVKLSNQNVRCITSKVDSCSSSNILSTFMVTPSSVNIQDSSILKLNSLYISTPRPILDKPMPFNIARIDLPMIKTNISYEEITPTREIEDPKPSIQEEKHAIRMIVIRKRKMRIHKLKKLRKRMKFVWAKIRQRRKAEKEKVFQNELMTKIVAAQKFDPAVYVQNKLNKASEIILPRRWRGKHLPEFIIKDLIEANKKKREAIEARMERRKNMNLNPADY